MLYAPSFIGLIFLIPGLVFNSLLVWIFSLRGQGNWKTFALVVISLYIIGLVGVLMIQYPNTGGVISRDDGIKQVNILK